MKSDTVAAIIILTLFVGMLALPIDAAEVEGTYYDDSCLVDKTKLSLTGVGLLRYWGFKAYTGAFYLEEGALVNDVLSDTARCIELEYFRSIKGKDYCVSHEQGFRRRIDRPHGRRRHNSILPSF